ncbi:MAG: ImmA/IrrE family metallo-endopeptidase [Lentilactobacillus diolivorans]|jgi:Zn-dependent peptidase ImmA (M78 family)|nr:ImmA/IrrE family metallo-endopeptidase [Lentilactobacillus diolivorans]
MDDVITYLLNLAFENKIAYELTTELNPYTPSLADSKSRKVIINLNWHNKKELPFQIAHEISHLLNGDAGVSYYSSFSNKSKYECGANVTAIDLLLKYYEDNFIFAEINPVRFMEDFGIPANLEYQVTDRVAETFGI